MILKTGTIFTAKDKTGAEYQYEFLGIDLFKGAYNIMLFNQITQEHTWVEPQWFLERTIEIWNA